jgi:glycerol-3-phosphate cytidylyltransferase-like family protein
MILEREGRALIYAQETVMLHNNPALYHRNRYNAQSACQYGEGVIRHERWCLAQNPVVRYACEIVVYPDKLTIGDAIILHSLGVVWGHLHG